MRETTVSHIPKEEVDYLKNDIKYIEFIKNELTRRISERLIQVLEENYEIILKKPVLEISEYPPTHSVEYRKSVEWEPLVRCRDCKNWDMGVCTKLNRATNLHQFCDFGERRTDE